MDLSPLPGFRDFYPEDALRKDYVFSRWRETARRYGFQPYDAPPLESAELYRKKSGDELMGQLYAFTDKGEREVAIRPEMTPSLARMIAAKGHSLPQPIKWFSIPQLFRYERQQRGRLREHFQFNCDILGEKDASADAELVALVIDTLRSFGLGEKDFQVRVSDRPLLAALLEALGIQSPESQKSVFAAVDKLTREPPEVTRKKMIEGGISESQANAVLDLFKLKSLSDIASRFDSSPAVCERVLVLQKFLGILDSMELQGYVQLDLAIVRGLAYYTGIVFEAFDTQGKLRAICGGGRYDQLVEKVGGVSMPALGFGMGDVVLGELLTERSLWPKDLAPSIDVYLVLADEKLRSPMLSLAHQLRHAGLSLDYSLNPANVGKQFKTASQRSARAAVVIGPEEWSRGQVKLKNLTTREEIEIPLGELQKRLLERTP